MCTVYCIHAIVIRRRPSKNLTWNTVDMLRCINNNQFTRNYENVFLNCLTGCIWIYNACEKINKMLNLTPLFDSLNVCSIYNCFDLQLLPPPSTTCFCKHFHWLHLDNLGMLKDFSLAISACSGLTMFHFMSVHLLAFLPVLYSLFHS